jgi:peptidoglycan glycosyltransferase
MNRQIRLLGLGLVALFVALFAELNYVQVVDAHKLANDPRNTRVATRDFSQPRGDILSADGKVLAHSTPTTDIYKRQRTYPTGSLFAQVVGYYSFIYGSDGVEKQYNGQLSGRAAPLGVKDLKNLFVTQDRSESVTLTLDTRIQFAAAVALGSRRGAVVAIVPSTGAILALWSYPSYDNNPLASHSGSVAKQAWDAAQADPAKPMLDRAWRDRFFPGSTFKMVTASAVFDHDPSLATKPYPVLSALPLPHTNGLTLSNFGGERCGGVLPDLFRVSCNTGFAQVGLDLGGANLAAEAGAFGFDQRPPIDLSGAVASNFPPASAFALDLPGLAKSAIGQQDVSASPLEMALVGSALANGGVIMRPHVMQSIRDAEGNVVQTYQPQPWITATSPATAATMNGLMIQVVQAGTGTAAQIPGVPVAGKTGTAQTGNNTVHTWFVAFAPANAPKVAVAVLVEDQPASNEFTGGQIAAPIAKKVIQAVLQAGLG